MKLIKKIFCTAVFFYRAFIRPLLKYFNLKLTKFIELMGSISFWWYASQIRFLTCFCIFSPIILLLFLIWGSRILHTHLVHHNTFGDARLRSTQGDWVTQSVQVNIKIPWCVSGMVLAGGKKVELPPNHENKLAPTSSTWFETQNIEYAKSVFTFQITLPLNIGPRFTYQIMLVGPRLQFQT